MKIYLNKIKSAIEIPFDPLNVNSNRDNVISSLIHMGILIASLYVLIGILRDRFSPPILIVFVIMVILFVSRIAVHRGKANWVSLFVAGAMWLLTTVLILFFENGLRAPAYSAVALFLIVYVGLLHGRRAVVTISSLTIVTNIIVGIMELQGTFLTTPKIPDIRFSLAAQIIFFPAVAFMVTRTLGNLKQSISLYREESKKRHQSEFEVKKAHEDLELAYETTLEGWAQALELRDKETEGHSRRVAELAAALAREMGFDESELKHILYGALLHDIGKMGIPDKILNKPGPLTPEEREIINQHPVFVYEMLKDIEYLQPAISIPYSHHENWDGTGYP